MIKVKHLVIDRDMLGIYYTKQFVENVHKLYKTVTHNLVKEPRFISFHHKNDT